MDIFFAPDDDGGDVDGDASIIGAVWDTCVILYYPWDRQFSSWRL